MALREETAQAFIQIATEAGAEVEDDGRYVRFAATPSQILNSFRRHPLAIVRAIADIRIPEWKGGDKEPRTE